MWYKKTKTNYFITFWFSTSPTVDCVSRRTTHTRLAGEVLTNTKHVKTKIDVKADEAAAIVIYMMRFDRNGRMSAEHSRKSSTIYTSRTAQFGFLLF